MKTFTSLQYVMIDIANQFGLDKKNWDTRIAWVEDNIDNLEAFISDAENPILYQKAINALDDCLNKRPSGHLIGLDATASGLQIMSAMAGCKSGCVATNLIDTGNRNDAYQDIADVMSAECNKTIERKSVKHPIMTHFYGSKSQPKRMFGKDTPELKMFYKSLQHMLPGACALMNIMQKCWDPEALYYQWSLPDGHVAKFKVMVPVDKKLEIDELEHSKFTYRSYVNQPMPKGLALAANIVHSIDAFICREMYRKAHRQEWDLLSIHDSFWCHPNYVNDMRFNYNEVFADYINIDLFNSIMRDIGGSFDWEVIDSDFSNEFYKSNYAIC